MKFGVDLYTSRSEYKVYPEDGGSRFLRNAGISFLNCKALRRLRRYT
jgi:hypothetical protein